MSSSARSAINRTVALSKQLPQYAQSVPIHGRRHRVTIIGSGNWGCVVSKLAAENVKRHPDLFEPDVRMWVFQETIDGQNLTDIINTQHENVKYLPGIKLPENLIAVADVKEAVEGSDLWVFNMPHQFVSNVCNQLQDSVKPHVRAISCIKGFHMIDNNRNIELICNLVADRLGVPCGVLSGANLAPEIAQGKFSETTIAFNDDQDAARSSNVSKMRLSPPHPVDAQVWKHLFHTSYFHVSVCGDFVGASLAGALKNIVAIGVGLVDGLGWGSNARAAIMRRGLLEMVRFAERYYPEQTRLETFALESCGVADLITTCSGGRNLKMGRAIAQTGRPFAELEVELLKGQSAQGIHTAAEIHAFLEARNANNDFPLFTNVYKILFEGHSIDSFPSVLSDA